MTCYQCNRIEWNDASGASFQVNECDRCGAPVCEDHADANCDSDSEGYRLTEWVCKDNQCNEVVAINSTFQGDDMNNERQTALNDLRRVINWLEAHPNVPLPFDIGGNGYLLMTALDTKAEAEQLVKEFGSCTKEWHDDVLYIHKRFGCQLLKAMFYRNVICERVVTGTEEVPEKRVPAKVEPAHVKEVVEWRCAPILAATEAETVAA